MGKKGQSLIEYSILIVIVLAAFIATSTYIKRSMQGRWKNAVDDFGDQYDPRTATGTMTYTLQANSNSIVTVVPDGGVFTTQRTDISNSVENTTGNITVN
jgi:hypothetical protein